MKFAFSNVAFTMQNIGFSFLFDWKFTCIYVVIVKKDLTVELTGN